MKTTTISDIDSDDELSEAVDNSDDLDDETKRVLAEIAEAKELIENGYIPTDVLDPVKMGWATYFYNNRAVLAPPEPEEMDKTLKTKLT